MQIWPMQMHNKIDRVAQWLTCIACDKNVGLVGVWIAHHAIKKGKDKTVHHIINECGMKEWEKQTNTFARTRNISKEKKQK